MKCGEKLQDVFCLNMISLKIWAAHAGKENILNGIVVSGWNVSSVSVYQHARLPVGYDTWK